MTTITVLLLFVALQLKHFIVDFPLQLEYQYANKGTYLHPGGLLHAGLHGVATAAILLFATNPLLAIALGLVDALVHYHIDWAKVNINRKHGWGPTTHAQFWTLLGLDQLLHQLTYVAIIAVLIQ